MIEPVLIAVLLAAVPLLPTSASTPVTETMTCPIGGASFEFTTTSFSAAGERPDGKPYGSGTVPPALPECSDNGLVLYKDYTPEEVTKLEPLVASEAYQALRRSDTQYYRAYWLMKEMGLGPERYLWALLQASWEADDKPELRARYQTELVEASAKIAPAMSDLNWVGMEGRAVNALRELGRFDEAMSRLGMLSMRPLDVTVPQGATDSAPVREAKVRRGWFVYLKQLQAAIERQDKSAEPFDLIPRTVALGRCLDEAASLSDFSKTFCERESAAVDQMREARARLAQEAEALRQSREASGR